MAEPAGDIQHDARSGCGQYLIPTPSGCSRAHLPLEPTAVPAHLQAGTCHHVR